MDSQDIIAAGSEIPVDSSPSAEEVSAAEEPVIDRRADRLAAASFVCGLIGVILLPLGLVPGFFGFALNLDARNRGSRHAKLDSGRILCLIAMLGMPLAITALLALSCETVLFMI